MDESNESFVFPSTIVRSYMASSVRFLTYARPHLRKILDGARLYRDAEQTALRYHGELNAHLRAFDRDADPTLSDGSTAWTQRDKEQSSLMHMFDKQWATMRNSRYAQLASLESFIERLEQCDRACQSLEEQRDAVTQASEAYDLAVQRVAKLQRNVEKSGTAASGGAAAGGAGSADAGGAGGAGSPPVGLGTIGRKGSIIRRQKPVGAMKELQVSAAMRQAQRTFEVASFDFLVGYEALRVQLCDLVLTPLVSLYSSTLDALETALRMLKGPNYADMKALGAAVVSGGETPDSVEARRKLVLEQLDRRMYSGADPLQAAAAVGPAVAIRGDDSLGRSSDASDADGLRRSTSSPAGGIGSAGAGGDVGAAGVGVVSVEDPHMATNKQGYLNKREKRRGMTGHIWKRRWFSIADGTLSWHKSFDAFEPIATVPLLFCTARVSADSGDMRTFEVISRQEGTMLLQAERTEEMREWLSVIQNVVSAQLNEVSADRDDGDGERGNTVKASTDPRKDPESAWNVLRTHDESLRVCADCGKANPEWASISLGVTVCILCSGVHRFMGVKVSKVRSLVLDQWEAETRQVMKRLGNKRINALYTAVAPPTTITQSSTREEREEFIRAKYVERAYLAARTPDVDGVAALRALMQQSTRDDNLEALARAYAYGAELNEAWSEWKEAGGGTLLHACVRRRKPHLCEWAILNGCSLSALDAKARTPLHVACSNDSMARCANLLIRRGASLDVRCGSGRTPLETARAKEAQQCVELLEAAERGDKATANGVDAAEKSPVNSNPSSPRRVASLELTTDVESPRRLMSSKSAAWRSAVPGPVQSGSTSPRGAPNPLSLSGLSSHTVSGASSAYSVSPRTPFDRARSDGRQQRVSPSLARRKAAAQDEAAGANGAAADNDNFTSSQRRRRASLLTKARSSEEELRDVPLPQTPPSTLSKPSRSRRQSSTGGHASESTKARPSSSSLATSSKEVDSPNSSSEGERDRRRSTNSIKPLRSSQSERSDRRGRGKPVSIPSPPPAEDDGALPPPKNYPS